MALFNDDFYKLHTGGYVFEESDAFNSSDDTDSLDESLKPPLYSFDEIMQNIGGTLKTQTNPSEYKILTEYGALATIIIDLLTPSFCYVCNKATLSANETHYNTKEHNRTLEIYINNYVNEYGFYLKDIDELICFACQAVFPSKKYAEIHYVSSGHFGKVKRFCTVCLHGIAGRHAVDHDKQPEHITRRTIRNRERERNANISIEENQRTNLTFAKVFVHNKKSVNNFKIHGIDLDVIKAIIEDNLEENQQCDPIAKAVLELMTPIYCFICNKSAIKNSTGNFKHYMFMRHKRAVKRRLQKFEGINHKSVYCEACNEIFLNNKLAAEHISTKHAPHLGSPSVSLVDQPQEKINSNNTDEYTECYEDIKIQIDKLIKNVYFFKLLPLEQSLSLLKELNEKLVAYKSTQCCESFKTSSSNNIQAHTNFHEPNQVILDSPNPSYNDEILELEFLNKPPKCIAEVTQQEYAKTKLSMEMHRLKMVISNRTKISSSIAFKYVQNLNQLLENIVTCGYRELNVFQINKNIIQCEEGNQLQGNIEDELDKLRETLFDAEKINVELALDFITQFNVQLEGFMQEQETDEY